jgi:hypothetical protein
MHLSGLCHALGCPLDSKVAESQLKLQLCRLSRGALKLYMLVISLSGPNQSLGEFPQSAPPIPLQVG